jgi:two-component system, chemotaxis family, protein-glutamate methylesterase/glutaminase
MNGTARRIRLLLVDDSPTDLEILSHLLTAAPDMEVVGTAQNGREALAQLPQLDPDLVITDYRMPVMDGLEFIHRAMQQHPCVILVLSVAVQPCHQDNIFRLLAAGALEVMAKPMGADGHFGGREGIELLERVRAIARSPTMQRRLAAPMTPAPTAPNSTRYPNRIEPPRVRPRLVAIGASTGGPQVLGRILGLLSEDFQLPIVCVQHISRGFLDGMLEWLRGQCPLPIEQAGPGTTPRPGRVYFAPEGRHLILAADKRFANTPGAPGDLHCPGVDRLLTSVAQCCGPAAAGVLLSGMGRDGAAGLKAMREAGAPTIVQDESSSVVFGMPAAAIAIDAAQYVLPTDAIAAALVQLAG